MTLPEYEGTNMQSHEKACLRRMTLDIQECWITDAHLTNNTTCSATRATVLTTFAASPSIDSHHQPCRKTQNQTTPSPSGAINFHRRLRRNLIAIPYRPYTETKGKVARLRSKRTQTIKESTPLSEPLDTDAPIKKWLSSLPSAEDFDEEESMTLPPPKRSTVVRFPGPYAFTVRRQYRIDDFKT
ncbi:hypothetical protein LTR96_011070 [Exophiala xenobiotica]|nr:hypothetical protein LTR41_011168 [Exophiala xenobiotica]KAK5215803.1 hypothetical protein LTR72_011159 [Exophiala xenobiotica]KAK5220839.1 hypothetical protein LTR47_011098 [Exophiala xenobiotica]KAK5245648.1 hypothetical protein LTS06_008949 [Exophiala xenobiotica]KAK5263538.1 hypothetical protein LTR96_011070 [Exophiala xenobiotica]